MYVYAVKLYPTLTEHELIKGCVKLKADCQRILYERYSGKFMSVCLRYANDTMEAEDMLQEAFIRIFANIQQFKFEGSFEGWMRRIVVNVALKTLQKKKLHFSEINDVSEHSGPLVSNSVFENLAADDLMKLINALPKGYKAVFNLNVIEGYSHDEIGEILGIEASTSRSQLVKARKMLQQQILSLQKIAV